MLYTFRTILKSSCLILMVCAQAVASGSSASFGPEKQVTIQDFLPHLMDEEGYYEEWSHGVWLEDGTFMSIDFFISNLGIGDHKGAVKMQYKDAKGHRTKCKTKYDSDEWSFSPNTFELEFGDNKLSGDSKGLDIKASCKNMTITLHYDTLIEPFMPGGGKLHFDKKDEVYSKVFTSPRAKVTGTVMLKGKKIAIDGIGLGEHSYSSTYPHKYVRRWFRFQTIEKDLSINIAELQATSKYARVGNGWVFISNAKGKIVATARAKFSYDGFIEDSRSDPKYRIPRLVNFTATEGEKVVSGQLVMRNLDKIRDPLDDLDSISRLIVSRFTKPKDYHIACHYRFKIASPEQQKDQVIQGDGTYRFVFANP